MATVAADMPHIKVLNDMMPAPSVQKIGFGPASQGHDWRAYLHQLKEEK
jgi:hypothetical protein